MLNNNIFNEGKVTEFIASKSALKKTANGGAEPG